MPRIDQLPVATAAQSTDLLAVARQAGTDGYGTTIYQDLAVPAALFAGSAASVSAETARAAQALAGEAYRATTAEFAINVIANEAPFRNRFHNPLFTIQQRGAGPWTTGGYTADRWLYNVGTGGGTRSISLLDVSDTGRTTIGDEEAVFALNVVFTGGASAGDYDVLAQRCESLHRFAGKVVTVSFWAYAPNAPVTIGVHMTSCYGVGGGPSPTISGVAQTVTVPATWTQFNLSFTIPSAIGQTFGAAGDYLQVSFAMSSGVVNQPFQGVGVQSGTVRFWGMQLELATVASNLEKRPANFELFFCQRFYQTGAFSLAGYQAAGGSLWQTIGLPVTMRANPTMTSAITGSANVGSSSVVQNGTTSVVTTLVATGTGTVSAYGTFTAAADL